MSDRAGTRDDDAVHRTQEQAVAAWVGHLNQMRIDTVFSRLRDQDGNLSDALASIDSAFRKIDLEVVGRNRGGVKGMHGFIAEVAEVGVTNARAQVAGRSAVTDWVNDNGPVDLLRDGVAIQQKFVAAGGRLGLGAISAHLEKYPDFVRNGGRYQIPADHFATIRQLHDMPAAEAGRLVAGGSDGPSFTDWQRVQTFFGTADLDIDALEPSALDYAEVQRGVYGVTLDAEKESLRSTDGARRDEAIAAGRATLREGAKATIVAGAVEGGTSFVMAVVAKRRAGKLLRQFTSEDWFDVLAEAGLGTVKGGVRGASIYALTNRAATPAAVASSVVTAALGIAEQANRFRSGEVSETEFIEGAELVALEAAVSAVSSLVGHAVIPVPVLGAVIGNAVGTVMYQSTSDALARREAALLERFTEEQRALDEQLTDDQARLAEQMRVAATTYFALLERAFSPDVEIALAGSVALAVQVGVAPEDVLDSDEKAQAYFLG